MRRFLLVTALFLGLAASAQVRTYSDLQTKTFVIGLDNYYFGDEGSLTIPGTGKVTLGGGRVVCGDQVLLGEAPAGGTLVGAHDFTEDGRAELLVALRREGLVMARVYRFKDGAWTLLGTVGARGDVDEIRVFRQALTVKDRTDGTLYTWTFHGNQFDFKSSSGGPDPALGL